MLALIIAVLFLLTVLGCVIAALAYVVAWRVTRPGAHTYWDEYSFLPADMGVPHEEIHFASADGLRLAAWFMPRPGAPIAVILGSGYRDRKASLLPLAAGLWKQGLSVLLFDFRNQGDSAMDTAQTMGWREQADMTAAVDEVSRRLPGARIVAMGWSMGAVVSILVAARDPRVAAVVADSAYADQLALLRHNFRQMSGLPAYPVAPLADVMIQWRAGYRPSRVRPVEAIANIAPRPILLIHGEQDDLCPVDHALQLFARAGEPKELWLVAQAKHVGAYFADPAAYIERVVSFLTTHLGGIDNGRHPAQHP